MASLRHFELGMSLYSSPSRRAHRLGQSSPAHFLDATPAEEASVLLKLLVIASSPSSKSSKSGKTPIVNGIRFLGPGEIKPEDVKQLVAVSL